MFIGFCTQLYTPILQSAQLHGFALCVHETVLLDIILYDIRFSVGYFFVLPLNQGMTIFCINKLRSDVVEQFVLY